MAGGPRATPVRRMTLALIVRQRAERQAANARDWYDRQLGGLGAEFIGELDRVIQKAHEHPLHCQRVHREVRRTLLRRFPFGVFYLADSARVVVLAVLHQSEHPGKWANISD